MVMTMIGATALLIPSSVRYARAAQSAEETVAFVKSTSDQLVAIVNSADSPQEKRRRLKEVLDSAVDVDDIAHFCLGRFWPIATPDQQAIHSPIPRPSREGNRRPSRRV
jgi:phospholipid transport system substrate-binding protein